MAIDLLKQLFAGYVYGYGGLRIHSKDSYTNITHLECEHFRNLGRALGYIGNREYGRMDLVWQEPIDTTAGRQSDKIVLYMERETDCSRFFTDALKKLHDWDSANKNMGAILVGLGGWITKNRLQGGNDTLEDQIKLFKNNIGSKNDKNDVLLITWIGPTIEEPKLVMATAIHRNTPTPLVEYAYARPILLPSSYWELYPIDKDGNDSMTLDWLQSDKPIWASWQGKQGSNWDNLYQQL